MAHTKGTAAVARCRDKSSAQGQDRVQELSRHHLARTGKVLLKIVTTRLSTCSKVKGLLPEDQCGFRPHRSTKDIIFAVRRLQGLGRKARVPLFLFFIGEQKAYDFVDRTLFCWVLPRFGVPPHVILIQVICQFQDRMKHCVRSVDGLCLEWFEVAEGLQGCMYFPRCCSTPSLLR